MTNEDFIPYILTRVDQLDLRAQKAEERYEKLILAEVHQLDRRVQHLEDQGVHTASMLGRLDVGLDSIADKLREYILGAAKDRVYILGGIVLTLLGVFGEALWSHLLTL